ncbi:MAG: glycosyltransferase [Anaerolineae bacterium]|nr:glycosyltransferase [Anaerolineae bacterium]
MKKVSIIIPTYNGQKTIQETLKSVFLQTYGNYEIIVVDDGSTDTTLDFIKTNFPSIKIIEKKNQGTLAARQAGINIAEGEYIALLDQDDIWFGETLQKNIKILEENPEIGLVLANMKAIDSDGNLLNFDVVPENKSYTPTWEELVLFHPIANSVAVFQKKLIYQIGGLDENFGSSGAIGDTDTFARIAEHTNIHFLNEYLGYYRWSETRPGRLLSFLDNLRTYTKKYWQHPDIIDNIELRMKFTVACCSYGIYIWRLLLKQHDHHIPLDLLEKLNGYTEYMQALFLEHYQASVGLHPVNLDFFPTEKELIRNLLFIYLLRRDLQELFTGVKEGSLDELLLWASDIAHQRYADGDFPAFETYNIELIYLEREIIKNKLEKTEKERNSLREELEAVYKSRFWRITAPIRKIIEIARYIRQQSRRLLPLNALPKIIVRKLIRSISLWAITHQKVHRIAIAIVNRFPEIKNRLKSQVYGIQQVMSEIPVYEQPMPMSPPVKKIYTDLVVAIENKQRTNSADQIAGE